MSHADCVLFMLYTRWDDVVVVVGAAFGSVCLKIGMLCVCVVLCCVRTEKRASSQQPPSIQVRACVLVHDATAAALPLHNQTAHTQTSARASSLKWLYIGLRCRKTNGIFADYTWNWVLLFNTHMHKYCIFGIYVDTHIRGIFDFVDARNCLFRLDKVHTHKHTSRGYSRERDTYTQHRMVMLMLCCVSRYLNQPQLQRTNLVLHRSRTSSDWFQYKDALTFSVASIKKQAWEQANFSYRARITQRTRFGSGLGVHNWRKCVIGLPTCYAVLRCLLCRTRCLLCCMRTSITLHITYSVYIIDMHKKIAYSEQQKKKTTFRRVANGGMRPDKELGYTKKRKNHDGLHKLMHKTTSSLFFAVVYLVHNTKDREDDVVIVINSRHKKKCTC